MACGALMVTSAFFLSALAARAQAPALKWSTAANAHLFAVDAQTNSYSATPGGAVVVCDATGAIAQTIPVCNKPGFARRDSTGDFYFFGTFDGTNDFGGTTLVGGWFNAINFDPPEWQRGYPTFFLAKYDGGGHLLWATNFGAAPANNIPGDMVVNPDDSVTIGYSPAVGTGEGNSGAYVSQYPAGGGGVGWQFALFPNDEGVWPVRLCSQTATNGFAFISYGGGISSSTYDATGDREPFGTSLYEVYVGNNLWTNAKPVFATNTSFMAGYPNGASQPILGAWRESTLLWSVPLSVEEWVLAGDAQNNLYLGGVDGAFSKYDGNGNLIWSTNYGSPAVAVIIDTSGNRFVSFNDGSVAELQSDAPARLPTITSPPLSSEVFAGDIVTLSVAATGTPPLQYSWLFNGTPVLGANLTTLVLSNTASLQSGIYAAVVTDAGGSMTSAPAVVTIKNVELFFGSVMLTNGTYNFLSAPTLTIRSAFPNGEEYYTLDGSTPSIASILYTGPFVVSNSATVKAIGYSSDFTQSELADAVTLILPPQFLLTVTTAGGGTVSTGGSLYVSNSVATVTATPAPGWTFLHWAGAVSGTNPTINITMSGAESVQAVFGTTLSTTATGNGQVAVNPPAGSYAYGSVVRLQGIPGAGSYFGAWGNAAAGSVNPLSFTITNANPTVSSLFLTLPANDVSLTTEISGQGQVGVNPAGNLFSVGQQVTITATPNAGQSFLGWSGGATGTQNPLTVTLSQSAIITANFTGGTAQLTASRAAQTSGGFTLTLISDPGSVYQIQVSTNLSSWQSLGTVTNVTGQAQFTDAGAANSKARFYRAQQ